MNRTPHDTITALAKMRATAIKTGWTTWLVHRGNTTEPKDLLCTIAPLPTDARFAKAVGRYGDFRTKALGHELKAPAISGNLNQPL